MATRKPRDEETLIEEIDMRRVGFYLVGENFLMHRFSKKSQHELLYPSGRKNKAERASTMKHNPLEEFQGCFYRNRDLDSPTAFHVPCGAFNKALAQAAIDIPGAFKAQVGRLTSVTTTQIDLYGVPMFYGEMVRDGSISRTPDLRFRPVFPKWACFVEIEFMVNPLTARQISNLLGAAGKIVGIGDSRPEKGGGSSLGKCGKWRIVDEGDQEYLDIVNNEGRVPQLQAFEHPQYYDEDTEELIAWFEEEVLRRRQKFDVVPTTKRKAA